MSKELEALNHLRDKCCNYLSLSCDNQVCSDFKIIETALKALEIIKEKPQTLFLVKTCKNYDIYFELAQDTALIEDIYSPKEFDLLKEVLL